MTINYDDVPVDYMKPGIRDYIEDGCPTGGFLYALLTNDLRGAVARADENNMRVLVEWVHWLYNEAPSLCWGSPDRVTEWMKLKQATRSEKG